MWPFDYVMTLDQPIIDGLTEFGDTQLYVTRGAGYWAPRCGSAPGPKSPSWSSGPRPPEPYRTAVPRSRCKSPGPPLSSVASRFAGAAASDSASSPQPVSSRAAKAAPASARLKGPLWSLVAGTYTARFR